MADRDTPGDLAGARVLVAGAGVTGRSVVTALTALGAEVTITDADPARLDAVLGEIDRVPCLTAPPTGTDLVVISPGWRPDAPIARAAEAAGIEVIGEVELAWRMSAARPDPPAWLAVTGTNGKTTTVGMLASILAAAGLDAVACGNVGLPVVDAVAAGHRVLAVELSSFQLYWQYSLRPAASVVLNIAEDHLDWHGSLAAYAEAKARIYTCDIAVVNADDPWSTRLAAGHPHRLPFTAVGPGGDGLGVDGGWLVHAGEKLCPVTEVRPPGPHNLTDALAASALARAHGVSADAVRAGLAAFQPGAHRSVPVGEIDGVRFVNDSKATNPHAAAASLAAFDPVVWIAGGQLKGASVDDLVAAVAGRLRGVVLLGVDAPVIRAALTRHAPHVPVREVPSGDDAPMTTAVRTARDLARPGDTVLLAPAAASLDMFGDYTRRGDAFTAAVRALGTA